MLILGTGIVLPGLPLSKALKDLYDDFSGPVYALKEGQLSPNGKWTGMYTGQGSLWTREDPADPGRAFFFARPAPAFGESRINSDQATTSGTHSALVLSTQSFGRSFRLSLDMMTEEQTRRGSQPNTWEAAWVMWNYVDRWHHYYFVLKTNGSELGKKDNSMQLEKQVFLATPPSPKLELGRWHHVDVVVNENRVTVDVDGKRAIDAVDPDMSSYFDGGGKIGLYTEDAAVRFANVRVSPY